MKPHCQSFWLFGSLALFWMAATSPMQAQIVEDATLPNPSIVTQNGNTNVITGGTQAGSNLFHSFREFSVRTGDSASFQQIDQGIENVISRVTGSSVSNIDGLIEARVGNSTVSSANFFLLNPNGIIFGPNAALNIGGSILASTASSLNFADGNEFSATNSQATEPLLTVSVPIGLQFARPAASIQVQGAGLIVPPGKTLGLVGGDVTLVGGELRAAGGRIELGSVTGVVKPDITPVQVSLTPIDKGLALGYEGVQKFQDIQLSQEAVVEDSGEGSGDIQVQGRRITLTAGSQIGTYTLESEPGGTLTVTALESVELIGSSADGQLASGLFTVTEGTGDAGDLTIVTRQLVVRDGAQVFSGTFSEGQGGNLTVTASDFMKVIGTSADDSFASALLAQTFGTGASGDLTIKTGRLLVRDGARVSTSTFGQGKAGNLTVQKATEVELVGGIVADHEFLASGLFTQTRGEATGAGGNLSISARKLIVREGAQVAATTFTTGNAGDLTVRTAEVELVGAALSADGELLTNDRGLIFPSGLFAGTGIGSRGDGGALSAEAERLSLRDGAVVQTSTLGAGDAGDLTIQATDSVEVIGKAADGRFPSSLLAVSGGIPGFPGVFEATGQGGNINLQVGTGQLQVLDGAAVAVSSLNPNNNAKGAGSIDVMAQTIRLDNQGAITAETASGQGGDITLQMQDLLLLRRNSEISTTAGIAGAGGDGGNIIIDTPFIVAIPNENSDIMANAFEGKGGFIQITAQQVFGLEPREQLTPLSDITAFSQQNPELNGVVEINTPDVDLNRGLVNLPADVIDASGLIASGCGAPGRQGQSNFIVTGRGGLPPSPSGTLSSETVWSDLRPFTQQAQNLPISNAATQPTNATPEQLVEAQGWVINNKGEVVLTASAPTVTPHSLGLTSAFCLGS